MLYKRCISSLYESTLQPFTKSRSTNLIICFIFFLLILQASTPGGKYKTRTVGQTSYPQEQHPLQPWTLAHFYHRDPVFAWRMTLFLCLFGSCSDSLAFTWTGETPDFSSLHNTVFLRALPPWASLVQLQAKVSVCRKPEEPASLTVGRETSEGADSAVQQKALCLCSSVSFHIPLPDAFFFCWRNLWHVTWA